MSTNLCIKTGQKAQYGKLLMDNGDDKTRSTEGSSKLCQNCRLIKQQMQGEIFLLKDKSHQSFMQVIQVQQLHQQQLQLIRAQHQQQLHALRQQIARLTSELNKIHQQLSAMEKNSKHHVVDFCNDEGRSFWIENIDMIKCEEGERMEMSRLDQSEVWQFHQIVETNQCEREKRQAKSGNLLLKSKYQKQQHFIPSSSQLKQSQNLYTTKHPFWQQKLSTLNIRIIQLQSQLQTLSQTNQQLKKQCSRLQVSQKSIKNNYQSLYKQSKFMADHIRQLANDKFKLQKRVKQLQRQLKVVNGSVVSTKSYRKSLNFDDKLPTVTFSTPTINNNNTVSSNSHELLFASLGYDHQYVVTTSRENSIEEQSEEHVRNQQLSTMTISKTISIEKFDQPKDIQLINSMTQSQLLLQVNNKDVQGKKSVPSYKKVSHITPTPSPTSFKKPFIMKANEKQPSLQLPKWSHQHQQQQLKQDIIDKSDFMEEIKMQLQRKVALKKTPIADHLETHRPSSLFISSRERRSTTKH